MIRHDVIYNVLRLSPLMKLTEMKIEIVKCTLNHTLQTNDFVENLQAISIDLLKIIRTKHLCIIYEFILCICF